MKTIYIARHGEAVPIGQAGVYHDFDRFLSEAGKASLSKQAKGFQILEPQLQACLASPLLRAQQTAELLCQGSGVSVQALEALGASPDFAQVLAAISQSPAERILVVSHQPFVEHLLSGLLIADHSLSAKFETGTIACVEMQHLDPDPFGELLWMMPAAVMAQMTESAA